MTRLTSILENIEIEKNLRERGIDFNKTNVIMDKDNNAAYFFLYNLSGQLVGYQRYNPSGQKVRSDFRNEFGKDNIDMMKYKTYVSNKEIAVWGLESYDMDSKYLFVVEGIFDCVKIHNAGYPAVASLANDPNKSTKSWLKTLPQEIIVIYDDDAAGKKLRSVATKTSAAPPSPYKDLGDMPQQEVNEFLKTLI